MKGHLLLIIYLENISSQFIETKTYIFMLKLRKKIIFNKTYVNLQVNNILQYMLLNTSFTIHKNCYIHCKLCMYVM